jgi:hypothetical protein
MILAGVALAYNATWTQSGNLTVITGPYSSGTFSF